MTRSPASIWTALRGIANSVGVTDLTRMLQAAADIALGAEVSFYDALYVATALVRRARLVTSDARLVRSIRASRWAPFVVGLGESIPVDPS